MPLNVVKRPQAERDIEECFVFIAEGNLDVAVHFLVAVEESLEQLSRFPLIGKVRVGKQERFELVRIWRVQRFPRYLLVYSATDDTVELIRVLHSSRDIQSILE